MNSGIFADSGMSNTREPRFIADPMPGEETILPHHPFELKELRPGFIAIELSQGIVEMRIHDRCINATQILRTAIFDNCRIAECFAVLERQVSIEDDEDEDAIGEKWLGFDHAIYLARQVDVYDLLLPLFMANSDFFVRPEPRFDFLSGVFEIQANRTVVWVRRLDFRVCSNQLATEAGKKNSWVWAFLSRHNVPSDLVVELVPGKQNTFAENWYIPFRDARNYCMIEEMDHLKDALENLFNRLPLMPG